MGFLSKIFGGGKDETPAPVAAEPTAVEEEKLVEEPVEEQQPTVDPNMDRKMSEAVRTRQRLAARRGRSNLITQRGAPSVSIVGRNN